MAPRFRTAVAVLLTSAAFAPAADPTLEQLVTAPDKYVGESLVLDKVKLWAGSVNRDRDGVTTAKIVSAAGKADFAITRDPPKFVLAPGVADQLTKASGTGFKPNTPFLMVCVVKRDGGKYVAQVTKMQFYSAKGSIVQRTFGD